MSPDSGSMLSFRDWLLRQVHRDDAVGDLARDVRACPSFLCSGGAQHTRRFLVASGACANALTTHDRAWAEFRSAREMKHKLVRVRSLVAPTSVKWRAVEAAIEAGNPNFVVFLVDQILSDQTSKPPSI